MLAHRPPRRLAVWLLAGIVPVFAQQPPARQDPAPQPPLAGEMLPPASAAPQIPVLPGHPPEVTFQPLPPVNATPEQLGDALEARQRYQAAIASYKKVQPPTAQVWNKMGIAYQMLFDLKDATRCYREAIRLDRHNPNFYNNLGTVYDSQKNYHQAEKMYRKALKLDPKAPTVLKNLGTNLLMQHKYSKGWEAYTKAMSLDPGIFTDQGSPRVENPSTVKDRGAMNYYMARGCVRMGQTECALQYLRRALDEGFITPKKLAADEGFFILRTNPAFQQLLAEQRQPKPPPTP